MTFTFAEELFSDIHKDAYGFRPSGNHEFYDAETTDERKQQIWDYTQQRVVEEIEREDRAKARASEKFHQLIAEAGDLGAETLTDAIRWIFQAHGIDEYDAAYGPSYVCYEFGLDYQHGLRPVFKLVLDQMYPYNPYLKA